MSYHIFSFVGLFSCGVAVVMCHVDSFVIYMDSMLNFFLCRFDSHT